MTEGFFLVVAIAGYAAATAALLFGVVFGSRKVAGYGVRLGVAAFAAQTASILVRLGASGRLPVRADYENVLAGTWAIVLVYLIIVAWKRDMRVIGAVVFPVVLVTLGFGATAPTEIVPLTPAYKSGWLVVHVTFAWITYACYTCASAIALVELAGERLGSRFSKLRSLLPTGEAAEELTVRLVGLGFLNNGVMIASGAIWAFRLWGSYWTWDPVETWSLITWLAFGLYLHLKLMLGWTGRRLAWLAVFGLFGVLMAFWGVQLFPSTFHLFREIGAGRPGT